ncbi:choline dehydrogenase 7 [Linnemannia zychae]|nr:choline dehydrogenase 7 [Linnemannia zychae]
MTSPLIHPALVNGAVVSVASTPTIPVTPATPAVPVIPAIPATSTTPAGAKLPRQPSARGKAKAAGTTRKQPAQQQSQPQIQQQHQQATVPQLPAVHSYQAQSYQQQPGTTIPQQAFTQQYQQLIQQQNQQLQHQHAPTQSKQPSKSQAPPVNKKPVTTKPYNSDDDSDSDSGSSSSGDESSSSSSSSSGSSSSSESEQEFKGKTPPPVKKTVGRKKNVVKAGGTGSRWAVPYDPVLVPMGSKTLEKILAWRMNNGTEELLIKHKFSSYLHVEWVPRKQIENGEHLGKNRVKKFMEKNGQQSDYEFFNPAFTKVDRIIDEGELTTADGEVQIFYLVKWCNTPYDGATWEKRDDILQLDPTRVHDFYTRKIIPDANAARQLPRPPRGAFRKLKESPIFKHGNQLRQYQMEGLNWLLDCWFNEQACIMADEMGLGKTVQSVTFLNEIHNTYHIRGPFLVIAPLSTIPHWHREFEAWTEMNVVVFHGNIPSRNLIVDTEYYYKDASGQIVPNLYKFDVLITTYEMIVAASAQLKPVAWRAIVVDEAHRLKNSASKVSEILKTYNLEHRVLLTGTPLQNSLDELFALLNFLEPTRFANEKMFLQEYGNLKTAAEVDKLQQLLKPLMLRRFKEDVEKSIPVKEETIIEVELTTTQKAFYRAILERNFGFLKKGGAAGPSLINVMMELRKCCIHPYLIQGAEDRIVSEKNAKTAEAQYQCLIDASGKLVLIDKLLKKLKEGGHKVLIFSQMTRCLDLLQDYLRGRAYPYERIDGSIRGDMRQAAIDRFSTLPDSFVFLLCTRAGGVGINLTAADTVVIFDSDWNPQNDLQATARCHRIGQTKPVQIYRLVTRNTYEKEMFDRASIKLGLDKAVLQKMDVMPNSDDLSDMPKPPSSLSKKEVEELLKKGAYGALLDDDETSAKFCEEDIDQILERRTTVIKHTGNEKGSVFSKATFSSTPSGEEVDVNDPQFWDKWAERAKVNIQEITTKDQLILNAPRSRRQVQRFGNKQGDSDSEDREYVSDPDFEDAGGEKDVKEGNKKKDAPRPWSMAERLMFERKLMIYGYGRWDQMHNFFPRRTEKELNAVGYCMVQQILRDTAANASGSEDDVKLIEEIGAVLVENDASSGFEPPTTNDIPFERASKKAIAEFRSFLLESSAEYVEHIRRKGRNLVLRVQLIHTIRSLIPRDWNAAKVMDLPAVSGTPPASWWGESHDRDLMLAIIRYGYLVTEAQYEAVRNDPEFCFYGQRYDLAANRDANDDDGEGASTRSSRIANYGADNDSEILPWPSKSDIGLRLRRIISALQRSTQLEARKNNTVEKDNSKERLRQDRQRQREEAAQEKRHQKVVELASRWTKKDKSDFYKTIVSFGVARTHSGARGDGGSTPGTLGNGYNRSRLTSGSNSRRPPPLSRNAYPTLGHDWTRFKELSGLVKKPDEVMEEYYHYFIKICQQVVDKNSNNAQNRQSRESSLSSTHPKIENSAAGDEDDDKEEDGTGDALPLDRAKRVLKRVELMNVIRDEILTNPRVDELLAAGRRSPGLPSWWLAGVHDKPFLQGLAKHGINRQDLLVADKTLPFAAINHHYATLQKALLEKKKLDAAHDKNMDINMKQEDDGSEDPVEKAVRAAALADQIDTPTLDVANGDLTGLSLLGHVEGIMSEHSSTIKSESKVEVMLVPEMVEDGAPLAITRDHKDSLSGSLKNSLAMNGIEAGKPAGALGVDRTSRLLEETTLKQESPGAVPAQLTSGATTKEVKPIPQEPEEFGWPKEAVVLRRVDHLIDIVMNPKPVVGKKRKMNAAINSMVNVNAESPSVGLTRKTLNGNLGSDADDQSDRDEVTSPYSIPPSPNKKPAVAKKEKVVKKPKEQAQAAKSKVTEKEKDKGKKIKAVEPVQEKGKKDKKRKGQAEEDDLEENEPTVPKKKKVKTKATTVPPPLPTSASLVTISTESNGTGPDGLPSSKQPLKLVIKLKMPIAPTVAVTPPPNVVKLKGKKPEAKAKSKTKPVKEQPLPAVKQSRDDKAHLGKKHTKVPRQNGNDSSGSDLEEIMANTSKQVEYLQRKIEEKKLMKRTPNFHPSTPAGSSSAKAKTPLSAGGSTQGVAPTMIKLSTAGYSHSTPSIHLDSGPRRSAPASKSSAGHQRGRSLSRSSRSSSSSRSRSSRSTSSSRSSPSSSSRSSSSRSRSASGSSSSSGSGSDSGHRHRNRRHQTALFVSFSIPLTLKIPLEISVALPVKIYFTFAFSVSVSV